MTTPTDQIRRFLLSKNVTLYGDHDITTPDGLEQETARIERLLNELYDFCAAEDDAGRRDRARAYATATKRPSATVTHGQQPEVW